MFRRIDRHVRRQRLERGEGSAWRASSGWNFYTQFRNYWGFESGGNHQFRGIDDLDTSGGPPIVTPSRWNQFYFVSSDSRKTWRFNFGTDIANDEAGGWSVRFGPGLNLKPSGRLQVSVSTNYTTGLDDAQWIENVDATGDGVVDYVYGRLNRDVVDVTVRSTFAVHRDMTVQVFLQPFVAVGDYTDFRRLARRVRTSSNRCRSRRTRTSIPSRCAATSSSGGSTSEAAPLRRVEPRDRRSLTAGRFSSVARFEGCVRGGREPRVHG